MIKNATRQKQKKLPRRHTGRWPFELPVDAHSFFCSKPGVPGGTQCLEAQVEGSEGVVGRAGEVEKASWVLRR